MSLRHNPAVVSFAPVSPVALARIAPNSFDSANKVDQIRLAAASQGMSHVIIYGQSDDQGLGGISATEQGLNGDIAAPRHSGMLAAIVVGTYSGRIYGAAQAQDTSTLTDKIQMILGELNSGNADFTS
ncbi:hypothetical protein [Robiginitomaculum antarcticum]|uniref:hypothetical protein n=1 Tax=Robiginitomaculum antarcticum TaxID=437507 RepID=UPI000382014D|nr:hypothetical protein [Robiginitomaculum antarcticum]